MLNFTVTIITFITPISIKKSLIELIEEIRKFLLLNNFSIQFLEKSKNS